MADDDNTETTGELTSADFVYVLTGPDTTVTYRPADGALTFKNDRWEFDDVAPPKIDPEVGLFVRAILLDSTRNGTRISLTLVLPEARTEPGDGDGDLEDTLTGVAIVTDEMHDVMTRIPAVLQRYDARQLEGTLERRHDFRPTRAPGRCASCSRPQQHPVHG